MNVKEKFIEILGEPSSIDLLEEYIDFVINSEVKDEVSYYCEYHHIIPKCVLNNDLVYKLKYSDHVHAHYLLAKVYTISKILRTLNFMLNREEKDDIEYRNMLSVSIKKSWKSFKLTKTYENWRLKRIEHCTKTMLNGKAKEMNIKSNLPENKLKQISSLKEYWTDDIKKLKSESMKEYYKIHGTQRLSDEVHKRYANEEYYLKFVETMTKVNKDENKRKMAGEKIKNLWECDKDYQEKMKKRNKPSSNSVKIKLRWKDPIFKEKILKGRKITRIKRNLKILNIDVNLDLLNDDEIIEKYGIYSRKLNSKTPNTELKNRIEVQIIKEYKSRYKIKNDPLTGRGWYRTSTENLLKIINAYEIKYGEL